MNISQRLFYAGSVLHHLSLVRAPHKECNFTFLRAFLVFGIIMKTIFILFVSFFNEVSNFRNRILANHKQ